MELGQLYWSTGLNTSGLKKDSSKASGILGKLGKGVGGMLNPAALGISAVGAAAVKIGKQAYEFSKDFNAAMLEVKTISGSAQQDFAGMSDKIVELSTLPIKDDAIGLSKAMYQIVSAGYDGAKGLEILEASAKAATGGVTDTMTAADGLTTVLNAWNLSASDVNKVSDQMFNTVKLGKTTFGELGQNIAKVAPLAAATGIEFEQVAAATATLTSMGTPTSEAFTQMKAAIVSLNKNLGDGWAQTMTLQEGMAAMRDMAGGSDTKLQELTGSSDAMLAVLAMTGDNAEKAAGHLDSMGNSVGAANEAFMTMSEEAGVKWQQVQNNWNKSLKELGDNIRVASSGLADFLNKLMGGAKEDTTFADRAIEVGMLVGQLKDENKTLSEQQALMAQISEIDTSVVGDIMEDGVLNVQKLDENLKNFNVTQAKQAELAELNKQLYEEQSKINKKNEADAKNRIVLEKALYNEMYKIQNLDTLQGDENAQYRDRLTSILNDTSIPINERLVKYKDEVAKIYEELGKDYKDFGTGITAENTLGVIRDAGMTQLTHKQAKEAKEAIARSEEIKSEIETLRATMPVIPVISGDVEIDKGDAVPIDVKPVVKTKTIKDLEDELKALEDVSGTFGDPKKEAKNLDLIAKKRKQIDDEWKKVRDEQYGKHEEINKLESKSIENIEVQTGLISDQLQGVEKLTDEEEKRAYEAYKTQIELEKQKEQYEAISAYSYTIADGFKIASEYLYSFDEEIASILDSAGNVAGITGDLADALKDGGDTSVQGITSLVGMLLELNKEIAKTRDSLNNKLFGEEIETRAEAVFRNITRLFGATLLEYPKIWSDIWKSIFNDTDDLVSELDLSGILSPETITDNVVDGLLEGFKLAEDGLGDFAESFGQMMQDAGSNYLKKLFEDKYLQKVMEQFMELAEDGLTDEEIKQFREDYRTAIENFAQYTEEWQKVSNELGYGTDSMNSSINSMGDAMKGITEETAGLIEGQFNSLRVNTLDIINIMNQHGEIFTAIRENTMATVNQLRTTNSLLQDLQNNTTQSFVG